MVKTRRKRRRGRPATGRDAIVPVRLPAKVIKAIDEWASVYRLNYTGMTRSTAIRCLLGLGLGKVAIRVVDPKNGSVFEGETLPLLKFQGRAARMWTPKRAAKLKPPAVERGAAPSRIRTVRGHDHARFSGYEPFLECAAKKVVSS
jgi:hypothetical protein